MNMNVLAVEVSKREAGEYQVSIAQIKEILAVLSDMMVESDSYSINYILIKNGIRRLKAKCKKK